MNREQLIEEAAKAAYEGAFLKHAPEDVDRWEDIVADNIPAVESWREVARHVLAVFEQSSAPYEHPAHSGHRYGGAYARAAALAAGDPDWQNATGTPAEHPEPSIAVVPLSDLEASWRVGARHMRRADAAESKLARIADLAHTREDMDADRHGFSPVVTKATLRAILNDKEAE